MKLTDITLFSNLDEHDLKELEKISKIIEVDKNDIIFYQGDKSNFLYLLIRGEAKIYRVDNKGNELILHHFTAPTLLAERANLANIPYPANCSMITNRIVL